MQPRTVGSLSNLFSLGVSNFPITQLGDTLADHLERYHGGDGLTVHENAIATRLASFVGDFSNKRIIRAATVESGAVVLGATLRGTVALADPLTGTEVGLQVPSGHPNPVFMEGVWASEGRATARLLESDAVVQDAAFTSLDDATPPAPLVDISVSDTALNSQFRGQLYVQHALDDSGALGDVGTCAITGVAGETVNIGQGVSGNCLAEDGQVNVVGALLPTPG